MTYKAVTIPDKYAQGSTFGIGFDTRIIALENQHEERSARGIGRRRYTVNLDAWSVADLYELYRFYVAVAQGSLYSFRMRDWLDYATTVDGVTHLGNDVTAFDQPLQLVGGRTYKLVKNYNFQLETYSRLLHKVDLTTAKFSRNGSETMDYFLDEEQGLVTFGGTAPIATATFGCEFFTQVRFTDDTDKAFDIALLGRDTGSLPSISMIEDLTDHTWSQYWPAGGAIARTLPSQVTTTLNQYLGKVWHVEPPDNSTSVKMPDLFDAKPGGPHFLIFNGSATFNLNVLDPNDVLMAVVPPLTGVDVWVGVNTLGNLYWVVT